MRLCPRMVFRLGPKLQSPAGAAKYIRLRYAVHRHFWSSRGQLRRFDSKRATNRLVRVTRVFLQPAHRRSSYIALQACALLDPGKVGTNNTAEGKEESRIVGCWPRNKRCRVQGAIATPPARIQPGVEPVEYSRNFLQSTLETSYRVL